MRAVHFPVQTPESVVAHLGETRPLFQSYSEPVPSIPCPWNTWPGTKVPHLGRLSLTADWRPSALDEDEVSARERHQYNDTG